MSELRTVSAALADLDVELERADHPIARYREPALSRSSIEAAFLSIGIDEVSDDLITLWEWQSSTYGPWKQAGLTSPDHYVLPGWLALLPIEKVVDEQDLFVEYDLAGITEAYVPAFGSKDHMAWVDSSRSAEPTTRTVVLDRISAECHLVFSSLVNLIDEMTMMLTKEYWAYYDYGFGVFWQFTPLAEADGYRWI